MFIFRKCLDRSQNTVYQKIIFIALLTRKKLSLTIYLVNTLQFQFLSCYKIVFESCLWYTDNRQQTIIYLDKIGWTLQIILKKNFIFTYNFFNLMDNELSYYKLLLRENCYFVTFLKRFTKIISLTIERIWQTILILKWTIQRH